MSFRMVSPHVSHTVVLGQHDAEQYGGADRVASVVPVSFKQWGPQNGFTDHDLNAEHPRLGWRAIDSADTFKTHLELLAARGADAETKDIPIARVLLDASGGSTGLHLISA